MIKRKTCAYPNLTPIRHVEDKALIEMLKKFVITGFRRNREPESILTSETIFHDPLYRRWDLEAQAGEAPYDHYCTWFANDRRKLCLPDQYNADWGKVKKYLQAEGKTIPDTLVPTRIKEVIDSTKILHVRNNPREAVVTNLTAEIPYRGYRLQCNLDLYDKGKAIKIIRIPRMVALHRPMLVEDICNVEAGILNMLGIDVKEIHALIHIDAFGIAFSSNLFYKNIYITSMPATTATIERRIDMLNNHVETNLCSDEFVIANPTKYDIVMGNGKIFASYSMLSKASWVAELCREAVVKRENRTKKYYVFVKSSEQRRFKTAFKFEADKMLEYVKEASVVQQVTKPYMCNYGCKYKRMCKRWQKQNIINQPVKKEKK